MLLAYREARRGAKRQNYDSVRQWLFAGVDPSTSVVLLEDLAAVLGVLVASSAMGITALAGHPLPDAVGAIGVSGILAAVAALIIHTNTETLIGRYVWWQSSDVLCYCKCPVLIEFVALFASKVVAFGYFVEQFGSALLVVQTHHLFLAFLQCGITHD